MPVVASTPIVSGVAVVVDHTKGVPLHLTRLEVYQRTAINVSATSSSLSRFTDTQLSVVAMPAAEVPARAVAGMEVFTGFLIVPYRTKGQLTKPNVTKGNAIPVP